MGNSKGGRISNSLSFKLALWLSIMVIVFGLLMAVVSFIAVQHKYESMIDTNLTQVALVFDNFSAFPPGMKIPPPPPPPPMTSKNATRGRWETEITQRKLPLAQGDMSGLYGLDETLPNGLHSVVIDGMPWRILLDDFSDGERYVFATRVDKWQNASLKASLTRFLPFFFLSLLLMIGIIFSVQHILKPVKKMANDLNQRDIRDLSPLEDFEKRMPAEIVPFVKAINGLLHRVYKSIDMQRRFVSDAAHELRSPLTALSLQAERLAAVELSEEAKNRLDLMVSGLKRAQILISQLLTLARVRERQYGPMTDVVISDIFRKLLEDILPIAESKKIDIGMISGDGISITAPEVAITLLLKNLLENAISYTSEGGTVDFKVWKEDKSVAFSVSDNGPGIPQEEIEHICDPFYRGKENYSIGSGLGLSIVKGVVDNLKGSIKFGPAENSANKGLLVTIYIPV